jgi:hypothetical protein
VFFCRKSPTFPKTNKEEKKQFIKLEERWSLFMRDDMTLQKIAEGIPKSLLNASDKDIEGFQRIIEETIKLREGHRNLQQMIKSFSTSGIQRT